MQAGDLHACVRPVALVQIDDHGRQPLERPRACKRAHVEGTPVDDERRRRERERELLRIRIVAADERIAVGLAARERRRCERVQTCDDRRAEQILSALGDRALSTGVRPIASTRYSAVGSAASDFTARTTRSTPATALSFAAPRAPTSAPFAAARSASREPITTS
jgi:hypothetical protein